MTILHPKRSFLLSNLALIILAFLVAASGVWMVVSYNHVIELKHRIADTAADLERVRTDTAEVRDRMFALLNTTDFASFAAARGLVADRAPSYITTTPTPESWALASRY